MSKVALVILIGVCLALASCAKKFKGDDAKMMHAAKVVAEAVNQYHQDNAQWPETLDQVQGYLPAETPWPTNPYNGQPLADTGNPDFDPNTSVGMVYYQRTFRNEEQSNYMLHVFGANSKLYVLGGSAAGLKE